MLNKSGECRQPCLAPDHREKAFSLTIEYNVSCSFGDFLGNAPHHVDESSPLFQFSERFYDEWC